MKKPFTVYLTQETHDKLKTFSEKKKWSLAKSMEYILEKVINKPNAKESNS